MSEDHWDSDRAYERDVEREPTYTTTARRRQPLSERGSVRVAHQQAQLQQQHPNVDLTARVLMRDDGVFGPCGVEYLAPKYSGGRKTLRARCTACDFIGREVGPAAAGDAYDEAKAHDCKAGAK